MLDLVINLAAAESIVLSPSVIHADLEVAPINAFKSRFPTAQLMACQFHVAKAWWSHMQEYGLSIIYKQINSDESKWLKLFFGLPALPPDEVENCFAFTLMSQNQIRHIKALITSLITFSRRTFCLIQCTLLHFGQMRQLLDEQQMLVRISIDISRIIFHQPIQTSFYF